MASLAASLVATATVVVGVVGPAQPAGALHTVEDATWGTVATTGGGFVTGLDAAPTDGDGTMYARTDIGGAYRRDDASGKWEPITDFLPSLGDSAYGVDGLAVDPTDPQHVWAAVGRVSGSGSPASPTPTGTGAVLRSTNGGDTWTDTSYPSATDAVINGNMDGRWVGNRIAVDPFNDDRAYFATRADGLWVHDNGSWSKISGIPDGGGITPTTPADREGYTTNPVGVSFVAMRTNSALAPNNDRARVVYAAVWDVGVYKSTDGGATFSLMANSPKRLRQGMVSRRDNVFYGVGELNGAGSTMALWRVESDGSWTNEQPCGANCNDKDVASIDIDNQGNIVVGVRSRVRGVHPIYYCSYASSTSCVGRWTNIADAATQQGWRDEATFTGTEHTSSLRFAPHAAGAQATSLWVSDFYGTSKGTLSGGSWSFVDTTFGIELTATTALTATSPSSSQFRLFSGALDVSGMYHDDMATTPDRSLPHQNEAAAGGSQDTTGIDVGPTGIVYRVGLAPSGHTRPGGYSTDNGTTWTGFTNSSTAAYGGRIAVAPDNADRLVWLPEATTLRHSTNRGSSWTVLGSPGTSSGVGWDTDISMPLAASQVSNGSATDDDFYYFDPNVGFHRATTSGSGLTFTSVANGLPTGDNQSWPGMRFGIETDPLRKDVVVAGVCGSTAANNGFWFSSNRGTTMTKRTGISCAQAVAIGAPLTSGGTSTIYVLGREPGGSSTQQVFFSTDDGVTWKTMDRAGLVTTTSLTSLEADPTIPGRIYLGSKGRGIFTGVLDPGAGSITAPAKPAAPAVSEGNASVTVDWTAPGTGGSPITGYRISVTNPAGTVIGTKDVSATDTIETITTLDGGAPAIDNGTSYKFKVAAINAVGTGAYSDLSDVAIPPHHASSGTAINKFLTVTQSGFPDQAWTSAELATFTSQLRSGAATTPSIIVARRDESDGRAVLMWEPLIRLYRASFLRQPDTGGMTYWMDELKNGQTMEQVANRFSDTTEFGNRYDSLNTAQFVEQVYQNVLGRSADAAGLAYWSDQIDNVGHTRGWVIWKFSVSSEYGQRDRHVIEACALRWGMTGTMPNNAQLATLVAQTGAYPTYDANGRVGMVRIIMDDPLYLARFP